MREPPRLAIAAIVEALEARYGLSVTALEFLPLGDDSASAVYRAEAGGGASYLLKVRSGAGFGEASLAVPHSLHERGVPHVMAPLATVDGRLWAGVGDYALSLYPFVEGRMGADGGLAGEQWRALGATVRQVHAGELAAEVARVVPREAYTPSRRELMPALEAAIRQEDITDHAGRDLAAFWHAHAEAIRTVVERADGLARRLRQMPLPLVLCHADLHTWNVLVGEAGELWLIDWDETILAPKERDLMFVVGGIGPGLVGPEDTARFLEGYDEAAIDPWALTYYRYAWAVQDMAAYAERVFLMPELGEETRREAVAGFMDMFEPGRIVDIALASQGSATWAAGGQGGGLS